MPNDAHAAGAGAAMRMASSLRRPGRAQSSQLRWRRRSSEQNDEWSSLHQTVADTETVDQESAAMRTATPQPFSVSGKALDGAASRVTISARACSMVTRFQPGERRKERLLRAAAV